MKKRDYTVLLLVVAFSVICLISLLNYYNLGVLKSPETGVYKTDFTSQELGNLPNELRNSIKNLSAGERIRIKSETNDLREKIKQEGGLWKADYNPVSVKTEAEKRILASGIKITEEDFNKQNLASPPVENLLASPPADLPDFFDWRNYSGKNYMTSIKNQLKCGSCWAFGSVGVLEGAINLYYNNPDIDADLSEQDLVSCAVPYDSSTGIGGCRGATQEQIENIFSSYLQSSGIATESCFSYTATNDNCARKCTNWRGNNWKIISYKGSQMNADAIKRTLIEYGPVVVGMYVYNDFFKYSGGIYAPVDPVLAGGHAVVIVGFGKYDGVEYWIVKNSWGENWGEKGYFRIVIGTSKIDSWFAFAVNGTISPYNHQKICSDEDGDGYCNWGLGSKPTNCPASCSSQSVKDCDDSNSGISQGCGKSSEKGMLNITSTPDNAKVYVQDLQSGSWIYRGMTPIVIELNAGVRNVQLKKYKYYNKNISVSVEENQIKPVNMVLDRMLWINNPLNNDVLRAGDAIRINGTAPSIGGLQFVNYTISYGHGTIYPSGGTDLGGAFPIEWSSSGISLANDGKIVVEDGFLGIWDTSSLTSGFYTIKIEANYVGSVRINYVIMLYLDSNLKAGWPQRIDWQFISGYILTQENNNTYILNSEGKIVSQIESNKNAITKLYVADKKGVSEILMKGDKILNDNKGFKISSDNGSYLYAGDLQPVADDVDNDGKKEIFVYDGARGYMPPKIYGFKENGNLLPGWPVTIPYDNGFVGTFTIADINNDGYKEIIVNAIKGLYIYKVNGELLRFISVERSTIGLPVTDSVVGDLNKDGNVEIVRTYSRWTDLYLNWRVKVFNSDGKILPGWPQLIYNTSVPDSSISAYCLSTYGPDPAIGDINNDGKDEIVIDAPRNIFDEGFNIANVSTYDKIHCEGRVYAFTFNGSILPGFPVDIDGFTMASPIIVDINKDGLNEIIAATTQTKNPNYGLYVINSSGKILSGWPRTLEMGIIASPSVGDFNSDGNLEIAGNFFNSLNDSDLAQPMQKIYLFDFRGNILPGWPQKIWAATFRGSIAGDLDGDNNPDLALEAEDYFSTLHSNGGVYGWDFEGKNLTEYFPKVTESSEASPLIGDIDNDGKTELITSSNWDYGYDSTNYATIYKNRGSIYVWETDAISSKENSPWPMVNHDAQHTNCYNCESTFSRNLNTCNDSDKGFSPFVRGNTKGLDMNGNYVEYNDSCEGDYLLEGYCFYGITSGKDCSNGGCVVDEKVKCNYGCQGSYCIYQEPCEDNMCFQQPSCGDWYCNSVGNQKITVKERDINGFPIQYGVGIFNVSHYLGILGVDNQLNATLSVDGIRGIIKKGQFGKINGVSIFVENASYAPGNSSAILKYEIEDSESCPNDCGNSCGDGVCDLSIGENCSTCSLDCDICNSCLDSDSGNNINVFGITSGYFDNNHYSHNDTCVNSTSIKEYFCSGVLEQNQTQSCGNSGNIGSNYCFNNSVYIKYNLYSCDSGKCSNQTSPKLLQKCDNGCLFVGGSAICIPNPCADSDGGRNYSIKGTLTSCSGVSCINYTDLCVGNILTEYYCGNNTQKSEAKTCSYGCSNGVCNSLPQQFCGDNSKNVTEQCDGLDLGGLTCASLGFNNGSLSCNSTCRLINNCFNSSFCGDRHCDSLSASPKEAGFFARIWNYIKSVFGVLLANPPYVEDCLTCSLDCGICDSCLDSDSGNNINVFGITSGYFDNNHYSHNDTCVNSTSIKEYFCSGVLEQNQTQSCGNSGNIGSNYCFNNSVYQNYNMYSCIFGKCSNQTAGVLIENCNYGCSNGACLSSECSNNNDCGSRNFENNFCRGNNLTSNYSIPNCLRNVCSTRFESVFNKTCEFGCLNGGCLSSVQSVCGDGNCTGSENCMTCASDCGVCTSKNCTDSDEKNYSTNGRVYACLNSLCLDYNDNCQNLNLTEFYCQNNFTTNETVSCDSLGWLGCYDGACTNSSYCGDGRCNNGEGCSSCSLDCGACQPPGSGGGGGGGGGSSSCNPKWNCTWGACINNSQSEICKDLNRCGKLEGKPVEKKRDCLQETINISDTSLNISSQTDKGVIRNVNYTLIVIILSLMILVVIGAVIIIIYYVKKTKGTPS